MNSLLRVVLRNSKLNFFGRSKHLNNNLTSIRQYSINLSSRYSRRCFDGALISSGTLRASAKNRLPTSFLLSSKSFATIPDDGSDDNVSDDDRESSHLPATVAVPEVWPHLPVIACKNNPVFPRFMKLVEVSFYISVSTIASFGFIILFVPYR